MFIVLGKADIVLFERLRVIVADAAAPILQAVAQPIATAATGVRNIEAIFAVYGENQRLHDENARLLQWQEVARRLEAEDPPLRRLVKFTPEAPLRHAAGRGIGHSRRA